VERGLALADAARELEIPARSLRAVEWDRRDLLGGDGDGIERQYAAFLGLNAAPAGESAPSSPGAPRAGWVPLLAVLAGPLLIVLVFVLGEVTAANGDGDMRLVPYGLVFVSSLLLAGAVLPAGVVARTPVSPASFARYRQRLALAAIGILAPVALFTLLISLD
jgi:helix-turn-helix protein